MDILDRLEAASTPIPESTSGSATVTNAAAGTFPDGRKKITADWRGTTIEAAYGSWYTPAVGHVVTFIKNGSSFFILGTAAR